MRHSNHSVQLRNLSQIFTWAILVLGVGQFSLGVWIVEQSSAGTYATDYALFYTIWGMGLLTAVLGKIALIYLVEKRRAHNRLQPWFLRLLIKILFFILITLPLVGGISFLAKVELGDTFELPMNSAGHWSGLPVLVVSHTALIYALGCTSIAIGIFWTANCVYTLNRELSNIIPEDNRLTVVQNNQDTESQ